MDKRTYNESDGGLVRITGATTPAGFPHFCPYQPHGATVKVCEEITSNYQRNLAGCCGTQDNRAFAPCNSRYRRCRKCLSEGKGSRSGFVVDVARGLCEECAEVVRNPPKIEARPKPIIHVPPKRPESSKPAWKPTPKPASKPADVPKVKNIPVREYAPPVKTVQVTPPALPGADKLEARLVEPKKRKMLKAAIIFRPPPQPEFDLDACAARYTKLSARDKEIIRRVLEYKRSHAAELLGVSVDSLNARFSGICTRLGIPRADPKSGFDRQTALGMVVAEVLGTTVPKPLATPSPAPKSAPATPVAVPVSAVLSDQDQKQERDLLTLFRQQAPDEKERILDYMKALKKS